MRPAKVSTQVFSNEPQPHEPLGIFNIGNRLRHPAFRESTIAVVSLGILTIDFGVNGSRRLGEDRVLMHCVCLAVKAKEYMPCQKTALKEKKRQ